MIDAVLMANRGEVAIRVARACAVMEVRSVAAFAEDDAESLHVRRADAAVALQGRGAAAYLDGTGIIEAAHRAAYRAVHPGYGFLSENADFAIACEAAGLVFVGPQPEVLALLGDKTQARALAEACGVRVPRGSTGPVTLEEAQAFLESLQHGSAVVVKAVAGGGGRGMAAATDAAELAQVFGRCAAEARAAFNRDELYVEELVAHARHIEVQVIGDGRGSVAALGNRECSVQRRHQKLIEIAPAPNLAVTTSDAMTEGALLMARRLDLRGLCTFEFLLDIAGDHFMFIEANPRLQVEHTVTEEVFSTDLVVAQLRIAAGATSAELRLEPGMRRAANGAAIQARVNMETMQPDGTAQASAGRITAYEPPSGPGVRVDGFGYGGYLPSLAYDSLLAKVIARGSTFAEAASRVERGLSEFRVDGVDTNIMFVRAVLRHPDFLAGNVTTRWLDAHAVSLLSTLPAAIKAHSTEQLSPSGTLTVSAPMAGTLVSLDVQIGQPVHRGEQIGIIEAMKMQLIMPSPLTGIVSMTHVRPGEVVHLHQAVVSIEPGEDAEGGAKTLTASDPDAVRPDLFAWRARQALTLDEARAKAVARRHAQGGRTARENLAALLDPASFIEYGALAVAAQRSRRGLEDLQRDTPADGVVCGIGTVNAAEFGEERATTLAVAYDYTVLAGTQGAMNHKKQDRLFGLASELRRPLVLLAEGGGGRPGDTDTQNISVAGLDLSTFGAFARLSALVPLVGVVHGRCFAGNAALLGCCDVIIATNSANIGMGGPAMIEGGGLGVFKPEQIGPVDVQYPNGVIDVLVDDEVAAVVTARRYLGYFQGQLKEFSAPDQRMLRGAVPENRMRAYDVRIVIEGLADTTSVMELRGGYAPGMVTALIRVGGRPMGVVANDTRHLGGAIDADSAGKAARFLGLCNAHGLAVLSLCDTPGFMVGPKAERTAQVRRVCQLFLAGANLSVPMFTVVLRKGYGLGAMAMAGGSFHRPLFTVSWPSGEFGGMGLEGAVRLGHRRELAAIADPEAREAEFRRLLDIMLARGKATSMASFLEVDAVIDPAETRDWLMRGLTALPAAQPRQGKTIPFIGSW